MLWCNLGSVQEITRSVTSTTQSGSAINRSGSAAQSDSAMNRSGSLRTVFQYVKDSWQLLLETDLGFVGTEETIKLACVLGLHTASCHPPSQIGQLMIMVIRLSTWSVRRTGTNVNLDLTKGSGIKKEFFFHYPLISLWWPGIEWHSKQQSRVNTAANSAVLIQPRDWHALKLTMHAVKQHWGGDNCTDHAVLSQMHCYPASCETSPCNMYRLQCQNARAGYPLLGTSTAADSLESTAPGPTVAPSDALPVWPYVYIYLSTACLCWKWIWWSL